MVRIWPIILAGVLFSGCVQVPTMAQLVTNSAQKPLPHSDNSCNGSLPSRQTRGPYSDILDPAKIQLLSWNVQKGGNAQWSEDLLRLSAEKDLVLLQEAHLTESFGQALEQTGLHWHLAKAFEYRDAETGVMTASTGAPSSVCLTRYLEPLLNVPKSALVTTHPLKNREDDLLLINLHGINFTFDTEEFAEQLRGTMEISRAHPGPVVVAGDFNDWNLQRTRVVRDITHDLGLRSLALDRDDRSRHLGSPVDHVFYRGLDVEAATAIPVTSSDHNPLLVTFSLSEDSTEYVQ